MGISAKSADICRGTHILPVTHSEVSFLPANQKNVGAYLQSCTALLVCKLLRSCTMIKQHDHAQISHACLGIYGYGNRSLASFFQCISLLLMFSTMTTGFSSFSSKLLCILYYVMMQHADRVDQTCLGAISRDLGTPFHNRKKTKLLLRGGIYLISADETNASIFNVKATNCCLTYQDNLKAQQVEQCIMAQADCKMVF